jgi:hypothetical protein
LWVAFLWDFITGKETIRHFSDIWPFLFSTLSLLIWPGTTIVTEDAIAQNRYGPLGKRRVAWRDAARVDYAWRDRVRQGFALLFSIEGLTTTVVGLDGTRVVHSAHNEGMLEFDRILRRRLPLTLFPESEAARRQHQTLV